MASCITNKTMSLSLEMSVMKNLTSTNNTQSQPFFFGHNLSAEFSLVAGLCFLAVIVVAVICNGVLITCIVLTRRLHSALHVFIVNLAACDVITAVGSVPFDVDYMWRGFFPYGEVFIIISRLYTRDLRRIKFRILIYFDCVDTVILTRRSKF